MAMKESGIEWVGLIPDTWSVIPNKYVMHKEKNLCEKWSGEDVMSLTMNGVIVRDLQNPTGKMPATFDGYQYIEDGDLLMCLFDIDVTPRCVGKVTHDGVTSPAYSNFKVHDNASRDYFYYYYLMVDNTKELLHLAKNLRHSFTEEQLGQLKVPMPSLSEQQAIADYLDETCSKIDKIIAEAKASIDEYKELKQSVIFEAVTKGLDKKVEMKDSGVEWIGKIPATWDVLRIKDIGAARNGLTYSPNDQVDSGKGTLVLRSSNVQNGQIVFDDNVYVNKDIPDNLMLDEGDILICSRNGSRRLIGKNAIVPESGKYTFGAFMMVLKPFNDNKKYIHWILNSGVFGYYLPMFFTSTINQLTRENFRNMQIPYCMDVNVQKDIVEYLDTKCELFDSLIAEKESLINDLEAYKKSLIYEVVTGKRRVV